MTDLLEPLKIEKFEFSFIYLDQLNSILEKNLNYKSNQKWNWKKIFSAFSCLLIKINVPKNI